MNATLVRSESSCVASLPCFGEPLHRHRPWRWGRLRTQSGLERVPESAAAGDDVSPLNGPVLPASLRRAILVRHVNCPLLLAVGPAEIRSGRCSRGTLLSRFQIPSLLSVMCSERVQVPGSLVRPFRTQVRPAELFASAQPALLFCILPLALAIPKRTMTRPFPQKP